MNEAIAWGVVLLNAAWLVALMPDHQLPTRVGAAIALTASVNASFALWQLI